MFIFGIFEGATNKFLMNAKVCDLPVYFDVIGLLNRFMASNEVNSKFQGLHDKFNNHRSTRRSAA